MADNQTTNPAPPEIPIPGMGMPPRIPAAPSNGERLPDATPEMSRHRRVVDRHAADKWDVQLKCKNVAGIGSAELRDAHEALDTYEEYVSDNYALLRDDWLTVATEKESRALAEYVNAGNDIPAKRESEVDKAIKARPLVLATARKLRDDVYKADAAARAAFGREAAAAIPRLRSEVSEALNAAETALADFVRAAMAANAANSDLVAVRVAVEHLPPFVAQTMAVALIDAQAGTSRLDDAIQNARRRIGPVERDGK